MTEQIRTIESPQAVKRYDTLKKLGKDFFASKESVHNGNISDADVHDVREFVRFVVPEIQPRVWVSYWEHIIIAPEVGRRIAEQSKNVGIEINPEEVEFSLWLHDIGRLVTPGAYLRNDFIGERLLREWGVAKNVLDNIPSVGRLLTEAENLDLSPAQLKFEEELNDEQRKIADSYFASMSPVERVTNLADNLGKRGESGLFSLDTFISYLRTQEGRYDHTSHWASVNWSIPRRQAGAVLQGYVVEKTVEWLEEQGVDVNSALSEMQNYGPKFVAVVRHGELSNPSGTLYNRDSITKPEDIMHLNDLGKTQMKEIPSLLTRLGMHPVGIISSPETRAKESSEFIKEGLGLEKVEISDDLDDPYAPGVYIERITTEDFMKIGGDAYDKLRWGKYNHEQPPQVVERMKRVLFDAVGRINAGESYVLVSHGDPIAWLANTLMKEELPNPKDLRNLQYPAKGEAILVIFDPRGEVFTEYTLGEDEKAGKKSIY